MRADVRTVDAYIASFPKDVQATLKTVRATIRKAVPEAEEGIGYGMPAYRLHGPLLYFAAFKAHWSLFALPETQKAFRKELARYPTSKGTVRFPLDEPVPVGLVRKIAIYRAKEDRAAEKARAGSPTKARRPKRRMAARARKTPRKTAPPKRI